MSRSLTRVPLSEASDAIEPQEALARRYVAYFRVSTQQQGNSGLGLDGQRRSIQNFLLHSPGDLLAEFTEIESGSKCDRPKLQEALRLCRVYGAVLLIARLDRLSRNVVLISTLLATGAEFIAADCPKANNFTIHVLAAAAEYELRLISERLKAALAALKARGVKLGGYRNEKWRESFVAAGIAGNAIQLKRAKARAMALAPLLRGLKEGGRSLSNIGHELTRMEIEPPRDGARWYPAQVRRMFLLSGEDPPAKKKVDRRSLRRAVG